MNEITPVRIIIGAVVLIVFCLAWISIWRRSRVRDRRLKERQAELQAERSEYLHKTKICPTCYGRGRVPAPGYYFTDDPLRAEYQRKLEARETGTIGIHEYRGEKWTGIPEVVIKTFDEPPLGGIPKGLT